MLVRPDELILKMCSTFTLASWIQLSLFMCEVILASSLASRMFSAKL
jgi:hypothetical protein